MRAPARSARFSSPSLSFLVCAACSCRSAADICPAAEQHSRTQCRQRQVMVTGHGYRSWLQGMVTGWLFQLTAGLVLIDRAVLDGQLFAASAHRVREKVVQLPP